MFEDLDDRQTRFSWYLLEGRNTNFSKLLIKEYRSNIKLGDNFISASSERPDGTITTTDFGQDTSLVGVVEVKPLNNNSTSCQAERIIGMLRLAILSKRTIDEQDNHIFLSV
jgi:hypothetical protein